MPVKTMYKSVTVVGKEGDNFSSLATSVILTPGTLLLLVFGIVAYPL